MSSITESVLFTLLLAGVAAAQQADTGSAVPIGRGLTIPIDTPAPGDLGTWAGGESFKVRLDGGFAFYPVLGPEYAVNLPIAWHTAAVVFGDGRSLVDGAAREVQVGPTRYEYRWPDVVEAYDIGAESVEQTFSIPRRPESDGDLVVTGRVETDLVAEPRAPVHAPLRFRGPHGRELVEYGSAIVVDAAGRVFPMTTAFDGARIELRLDAEAVRAAEFPILVDPNFITNDPVRAVGMTAVETMPFFGTRTRLVVCTRINSATDHDVIAYNMTGEHGLQRLVYSALGVDDAQRVAVCAVRAAHRFVITHESRQGFTTDLVLRSQIPDALGAASGSTVVVTAASGEHYRNPAAGGTGDGLSDPVFAVVAFDHATLTVNHAIDALTFDPITGTVTHLPNLAAVPVETRPAISPIADPSWVVCWNDELASDRRVLARKITGGGLIVLGTQTLRSSASEVQHDVKVAGGRGEFMATWESSPIGLGARAVRGQRFAWPDGAQPFALRDLRTISIGASSGYTNDGLAFDSRSQSHWVATYTRQDLTIWTARAARLGFKGTIVEEVQPHGSSSNQPHALAVAYDRFDDGGTPAQHMERFALVYALNDSLSTLFGDNFGYVSGVYRHTWFGTTCASVESESWTPGKAGGHFAITLVEPVNVPAAAVIGQVSASLPLDVIGMTGCTYSVEPAVQVVVPGTPDGAGRNRMELTLPQIPVFTGFFFTQWIYLEPGANALGIVANRGVAHEAR